MWDRGIIMPQTNQIKIDEKKYIIIPSTYQKRRQETIYPRFSTGEPNLSDLSIWQYQEQSDWRGGAGQKDWIEKNKFYNSCGIKPELQKLQLASALTADEPSGGNTTAPDGLSELGYTPDLGMWWKGRYWFTQSGDDKLYMASPAEKPAHVPASKIITCDDYSNWIELDHQNLISLYIFESSPIASLTRDEYQYDYLHSRIRLSTNIPGISGREFTIKYTVKNTLANTVSLSSSVLGSHTTLPNQNIVPGTLVIDIVWAAWNATNYVEKYQKPIFAYKDDSPIRLIGYEDIIFPLQRLTFGKWGHDIGVALNAETGWIAFSSLGPGAQSSAVTKWTYSVTLYDPDTEETVTYDNIIGGWYNTLLPQSGTWLHRGPYVTYNYNTFEDREKTYHLYEGVWQILDTLPTQEGSEIATYNPPGAAINLRESYDYLPDLTTGRIKPLEAGRMMIGGTYTASYVYQDKTKVGSVDEITTLDDIVTKMLSTDLLYLQIGDHQIWACDGTTVTKMIDQQDLVITSIVYWAGKTFYSGNRNGDGYVYEFLNPQPVLILEGEEIDNLSLSEHLLIKSGDKIYCYTGAGYYLNQDGTTVTEGWIHLSGLAGNTPFIMKIFKKLFLKFEGTIPVVKIRTNLTDDWKELTLYQNKDQSETYEAEFPENYISTLVYIKLEIADATTKIDQVMINYLPYVFEKLTWTFTIKSEENLKYKSALPEQRNPIDLSKNLWEAKSKGIVEMVDLEGGKYKVIIYDLNETAVNLSGKRETHLTPVIIEV
jgi:hypothetical protein